MENEYNQKDILRVETTAPDPKEVVKRIEEILRELRRFDRELADSATITIGMGPSTKISVGREFLEIMETLCKELIRSLDTMVSEIEKQRKTMDKLIERLHFLIHQLEERIR